MPPKPKTHDEYIAQAPEFARKMLERIRASFRTGCPDAEETMKWGIMTWEKDGIMGAASAHKAHIRLAFWGGRVPEDPEGLFEDTDCEMPSAKFADLKELPGKKVLSAYVKRAAASSAPKKKVTRKDPDSVVPPDALAAALKQNRAAKKTWDGFSYTCRLEYASWIEEAKREATRDRRVAQAVEWMAEGKPRNWKYMKEWGGC